MENLPNPIKFMLAADAICVDKGKTYNFPCPVCKGNAKTKRAENGHIHAYCEECDMNITQ